MTISVFAPIPSPGSWLISPESTPPAGYLLLASVHTAQRGSVKDAAALLAIDASEGLISELLEIVARLAPPERTELLEFARALDARSTT